MTRFDPDPNKPYAKTQDGETLLTEADANAYMQRTLEEATPDEHGCVRFAVPDQMIVDGTSFRWLNPATLTFHTPDHPEFLETEEDHDPPISSEDVGQHFYDLPDIRRHIARRDSYAEMERNGDPIRFTHHFGNHAYDFLTQHPRCTIRIVDEYGSTYPLQEDTP